MKGCTAKKESVMLRVLYYNNDTDDHDLRRARADIQLYVQDNEVDLDDV